jgi:hypothetical protein
MRPLNPFRARPRPKPEIAPRWDTAFQYAGKSEAKGGIVPKVPARPEDVRSLNSAGRPLPGSPPTEKSDTGKLKAGTLRPDRDAAMDPDVALRLHAGAPGPQAPSEAVRTYDVLTHHLSNSGAGVVQSQLPIRPHGTHVPDPHLEAAGAEFKSLVKRKNEEGDEGLKAPKGTAIRDGEFEALIRKAEPGRPASEHVIETLAYEHGSSGGRLDPGKNLRSDYRLHSHPFDPADTRNQRTNFPSGGDYLAAAHRDMQSEAAQRLNRKDVAPQRHVLLHDDELFLFPGASGRLTFDRIGPAGTGPERPAPGGEDRDRYSRFAFDPKAGARPPARPEGGPTAAKP